MLSSSGSLTRHAFLDGAAELEEALAHLLDGELVERAQSSVAQMVDVVDVGTVALAAQVHHVSNDGEEVVGTDALFRLVADGVDLVVLELPVDAETSHATEAVAVLFEELLVEELTCLVDLRWVAGTKSSVDLQECRFVLGDFREEVEALFGEGVEDQRVAGVLDDADGLQLGSLDHLERVAEHRAGTAQFFTGVGVDDELGRVVLGVELLDLDVLDLVEEFEELVGRGELLVQGAQEGRRGQLGRLVDSHRQHVLLGHFDLDPGTTFGDDSRAVQRAVTERGDDREVDAGGAVKLRHDAAFGSRSRGTLPPTHHDRNLAEVDLLFGDFVHAFAVKPDADAEGTTVGQSKLPAFVRGVSWFVQLVIEILEAHRAVVALDREHFLEKRLKAE